MRFVRGGPRNWTAPLIPFLVGLMCGNPLEAQTGGVKDSAVQEQVEVTEVTPQVLVFATSTGNVVASVGPATTEALEENGIHPDFEPSRPKMGFLVQETAERAEALLKGKR